MPLWLASGPQGSHPLFARHRATIATLTAQAEITPDHRLMIDMPLSADLPAGRIEVTVALAKPPQKLVSNQRKAVAILRKLADRGRILVPHPVAWQREVREGTAVL